MIVRLAERSDLTNLALAARFYFDVTFSPDNDPVVMQEYLDSAFTTDQFIREFEEKGSFFLLAEEENKIFGYARIRQNTEVNHLLEGTNFELQRLYVDPVCQGTGLADKLIAACIRFAGGFDWMWLGVWEKNPRAVRFYSRHGFFKFSTHHFRMGNEDQIDLLMCRRLSPA